MSDQEKETGEWVAWQSMGPGKRPGRRSRRHYTRDGKHAVCGRPIPEKGQVLRFEAGVGDGVCPRCERTAPQEVKEPKSVVRPVAGLVGPPCAVYAVALLFERGIQRRLVSLALAFRGEGPLANDDVLAWARSEAVSSWPQELGAPEAWRVTDQSLSRFIWRGDKLTPSPAEQPPNMVFNPSLGRMVPKNDTSYLDIAMPPQGQKTRAAPEVQGVADMD